MTSTTPIDVTALRERLRKALGGHKDTDRLYFADEAINWRVLLDALDRAEAERDDFAEQIAAYHKGEKYFEQQAVMERENALRAELAEAKRERDKAVEHARRRYDQMHSEYNAAKIRFDDLIEAKSLKTLRKYAKNVDGEPKDFLMPFFDGHFVIYYMLGGMAGALFCLFLAHRFF